MLNGSCKQPVPWLSNLASIGLGTCSSELYSLAQIPLSSGVPVYFLSSSFLSFFFFFRKAPQEGFKKKQKGRAFSTALLIDEMFPLPAQLFRPFSLENSQWHPVRFASWFICHISFISLNSLYLSSGSMHLSWVPQQCLQARSKHILHVTPQLRARLFHPGCVGSMKNWLSDAVNFYSSHHQVFWHCQCQESPCTSQAVSLFLFLSFFLLVCVNLEKLQEEHLSDLEKAVLLRMSDWHN